VPEGFLWFGWGSGITICGGAASASSAATTAASSSSVATTTVFTDSSAGPSSRRGDVDGFGFAVVVVADFELYLPAFVLERGERKNETIR
jgi:hypothetical protein